MKKTLLLLGLTLLILLGGCKKPTDDKFTCTITSPKNGAELSIYEDIVVNIETKNYKGTIAMVVVWLENAPYPVTQTAPYTCTIPASLLTLGEHTIKAVATTIEGAQAESFIKVKIVESGGGGNEDESPNFVSFTANTIPASWKTNTWVVDVSMGYDADNHSLRSDNPVASVLTTKTVNAASYVEFYTRGDYFDLFIDNVKATALSSTPDGSWKKWIYAFDKGKHSFRWENTNGATIHLDAVKFASATVPTVTTNTNITNIAPTSATSGGNVTGNPIAARGVCWSTSENPTIDDNKTTDGTTTGSFTSKMTELTPNTTYYVRAYATNGAGTSYGEQVSFTTIAGVNINGTIWATRNVDYPGTFAENPEDAGMFYQWNRKIGWSSTYPIINSNGGTTWDSTKPTGSTWEKENDPCPTGWRVPTDAELQSLIDAGSKWATLNGVKGSYFGSGDNTLFLPAAGERYYYGGSLFNWNLDGYYWSSTLVSNGGVDCLLINYINYGVAIYDSYNGFSVRCVAD